jgi:EpsI family protein
VSRQVGILHEGRSLNGFRQNHGVQTASRTTSTGGSMSKLRLALIASCLMLLASLLSAAGRSKLESSKPTIAPYQLSDLIPSSFGIWSRQADTLAVVNPQTQQLIDKLYSQTLSRTYANSQGYRIMLSIAYGSDQRGGLQAHLPEVCYPAQGFVLRGQSEGRLETPQGVIPVTRLKTELGTRAEPVTYWLTMGEQAMTTRSRMEKRMVELRYALTGTVPDGLLFRLSSIDGNPDLAYAAHDDFARALLSTMSPKDRSRVAGFPSSNQ